MKNKNSLNFVKATYIPLLLDDSLKRKTKGDRCWRWSEVEREERRGEREREREHVLFTRAAFCLVVSDASSEDST